jgi:spermidine export protein MdtI
MNTLALFFVICSALIDVAANMMVAKSEVGRWRWGVAAIVMVWIAFALLGQAVRYMDATMRCGVRSA